MNFQTFALRDMKMAVRESRRVGPARGSNDAYR